MAAIKNPPKVGEVYPTKKWGDVVVVDYVSARRILVEFKDGHRKFTAAKELRNGMVKNNFQPEVCGVGFMGEGNYYCKLNGSDNTLEYDVWRGMLRRCYDEKSFLKRPTYKGCSVHQDWHNFQNFAEWYTKQPAYGKGWHLDKDLMVLGNKVYSENTCALIPPEVNSLLTGGSQRVRGDYPIGVHFCNKRKMFIAQIHREDRGAQQYLGKFHDPKEAFAAYKGAKEDNIKLVARKYRGILPDVICDNLINYEVRITD